MIVRTTIALLCAACCVAITACADPQPAVNASAVPDAHATAAPGVEESWPELKDVYDDHLQAALRETFSDEAVAQAIAQKRLAVALLDVTVPRRPRLAGVNDHQMMYAASLPKIAILLAAFQKAEDEGTPLDQASLDLLTAMIRSSSNTAATEMIDRLGFEYIEQVVTSERYHLYEPDDGGLWVGKAYARSGAWKRDPVGNLSHGASAFEAARFFYLLETGQLVTPEASAQMKTILGDPGIQHKFVGGLAKARPGSKIFRKSGTWRTYHSDGALVERDGRKYIAVGMCNDEACGAWFQDLIVELDDIIFAPENVARDRSPP
jgi:beta-lactamase class A